MFKPTSSLAQFRQSLLRRGPVVLPQLCTALILIIPYGLLAMSPQTASVFESGHGGGQSNAVAQQGRECPCCNIE